MYLNKNNVILVGTPGRIFQLINMKLLDVTSVKFLVLDEIDKTIEMQEMPLIIQELNKQQRQNLMFSATMENKLLDQIKIVSKQYQTIKVQENNDFVQQNSLKVDYISPDLLDIVSYTMPIELKIYNLLRFINKYKNEKVIIFTLTCNISKYLAYITEQLFKTSQDQILNQKPIFYLHGKQNTNEQIQSYDSFIQSQNGVLFTTDIAARGLDISKLNYVIQLDPPKIIDTFIHRAGRVARNGKKGMCICFSTLNELGIIKILRDRGMCIRDADINKDLQDSIFNSTVLNQQLIWKEKTFDNSKIQFHKKQLKKYNAEKEKLRNKGISEQIIYKKYGKAEKQVTDILNQELKGEQDWFEYEKQIYNTNIAEFLRQLQINDREILDLCQQAFISYVRAYKEYQLQILLNLKTIRLGSFGMSLGLLSLPKIAELQGIYVNFQKYDGNLSDIKYKNQKLEERHQHNIQQKQLKMKEEYEQQQQQQQNQEEQEQPEQKFDKEKYQKSLQLNQSTQKQFKDELDLLMKYKAGEITEEQFEKEMEKIYK